MPAKSSSQPKQPEPANKKHEHGLFLFHRDLRVDDNLGLHDLSRRCNKVHTCFIFTPEQVGPSNKYKSDNAVQFMIESLEDLASDLAKRGGRLIVLHGATFPSLKHLIDTLGIEVVGYNRDYSPYAMKRDLDIRTRCKAMGVECIESSDYYLYEPGEIGTGGSFPNAPYNSSQKKPYQKYTPFYENVLSRNVPEPHKMTTSRFVSSSHRFSGEMRLEEAMRRFASNPPNTDILVRGGRENARAQFHKALQRQEDYTEKRDEMTYETTFLSAYIKFGCLSIREVYHGIKHAYGLRSGLLRELIWREFFAHVLYGFPEVLSGTFTEKYQHIKWRISNADFDKWRKGRTGFPLVDACMRQMNRTGYMHNRGRMVVATFLAKTLLLNWRLGEQYFAKMLTDYDPASNNGNWQSIASTGVDNKPYYRDMNPWIQSVKFDKDAAFIKRWVPELKDVPPRDIHKWDTKYSEYKVAYPAPMVDYKEQKEKMMEMYSQK